VILDIVVILKHFDLIKTLFYHYLNTLSVEVVGAVEGYFLNRFWKILDKLLDIVLVNH